MVLHRPIETTAETGKVDFPSFRLRDLPGAEAAHGVFRSGNPQFAREFSALTAGR
jgi:hypothetical protein